MNANGEVSICDWKLDWIQLFSTFEIFYFERRNNRNAIFIHRCIVFINESSVNMNLYIELTMLPRAENK